MSLKKFENNDLFFNIIKTKPRFQFKLWGGNIYLNNQEGNAKLNYLNLNLETTTDCGKENILDFSCAENSYNVGIV